MMSRLTCHRCGDCCKHQRLRFTESPLCETEPLLEAMKKYVHKYPDGPCLMLGFEKGKAICILEKLYGKDAKPEECKKYWCKKAGKK